MRLRDDPPRFKLGAGAYVMSPDGRLLLVEQERRGVRKWGGLGGGIERGESIEQCARRETFEECGLRVRLVRLLSVTEYWGHGVFDGPGFLFLAEPDPWPQEVVLPDMDGATRFHRYGWFTRDEIASIEMYPDELCLSRWPTEVDAPLMLRLDVA